MFSRKKTDRIDSLINYNDAQTLKKIKFIK